MNFSKRSNSKELLDRNNIPFPDIERNMKELNFINTYLGGHKITIDGLKKLLSLTDKELVIAEIGCGGGDNLYAIEKYCEAKKVKVKLIGIDFNPSCIQLASATFQNSEYIFIDSDYKLVRFENEKPDIIFSSLFCHHFSSTELVEMLKWMTRNCSTGFFINDLHRHPIAYYSIKFLVSAFSKSYMVKNDAPLSVLRGFKKKEWMNMLADAGIKRYSIQWKWAYRYLVCVSLK